jgi:hypothetical protein
MTGGGGPGSGRDMGGAFNGERSGVMGLDLVASRARRAKGDRAGDSMPESTSKPPPDLLAFLFTRVSSRAI